MTAIVSYLFAFAIVSQTDTAVDVQKTIGQCHAWGVRKSCDPTRALVYPVLFENRPTKKNVREVVGSPYGPRCNPVASSKGRCVQDFHLGMDVKMRKGIPVLSVRDDGTVEEITPINNCLLVRYRWMDGGTSVQQRVKYCHLRRVFHKVGDHIDRAGDVIGEVGDTGHVHGAHLHLEMEVPQGGMTDWQASHCVGKPPADVLKTDYEEVRFETFDPSCYGWKMAWRFVQRRP
ncbi:M23 family metallopeptidase [Patescibacteria group bacterium]|nr:MAG: M23 family metallopeptidase [Patescibacteria group bacterium]